MDKKARHGGNERDGPSAVLSQRIAALIGLAREMGAMLERGVTGHRAIAQMARNQIELERAVARILEAEQALNEWHDGRDDDGRGAGTRGDIDFDAVRHEIGCRLSRLRECCRPD
jgi:hypothetical protein